MANDRLVESSRLVREAALAAVTACRDCCTGHALRAAYERIVAEGVPPHMQATLDRLGGDAR